MQKQLSTAVEQQDVRTYHKQHTNKTQIFFDFCFYVKTTFSFKRRYRYYCFIEYNNNH